MITHFLSALISLLLDLIVERLLLRCAALLVLAQKLLPRQLQARFAIALHELLCGLLLLFTR